MFTDKTGKFPQCSGRGNNYQVVAIDIFSNSNWIKAEKDRTTAELITAHWQLLSRMKSQGIFPKHQVLDNEISQAYKDKIAATGINYQLVLPNNHRHNIA